MTPGATTGEPMISPLASAGAMWKFNDAWRLTFKHPIDGRELSFESPLPEDLRKALERLEAQN